MANYGVNINFKVIGQSKLDRALKKTEQLDKKVDILNKRGIKGISNAVKILERELAIKNKILQADKNILSVRQKQIKANKANAATQPIPRTGGGFGGGGVGSRSNRAALSSGLISGAFPLLFGQGPLGGAFGFAGGFAGTKIGGQMGGFAGGLVATAALQQITSATEGIKELGKALDPETLNIDTVSKSLGLLGTDTEKYLNLIERTRGKQAAYNAAVEETTKIIGTDGVQALKSFADSSQNLTNEMSKFFTRMGAGFAQLFDRFGKGDNNRIVGFERSNLLAEAKQVTDDDKIVKLVEKLKKARGKNRDTIADSLVLLMKQRREQEGINIKVKNTEMLLDDALKATDNRNTLLQDTLRYGEDEALIRQKISDIEKNQSIILDANGKQRIRDAMELERSLQRQIEFTRAIGVSFRNSFRDAITGATSFNQAMVNVLNTIRDRLIGMYLDQMFAQATTGGGGGFLGKLFGGLVGGIFGGGGAGAAVAPLITDKVFDTTFDTSLISAGSLAGKFANGGFAQKGKSYLVGERGPELFTPGATGGQISPMGSTNIVVNVDASGSSVQGSEEQSKVLGQVLASAIQSELIKQKRPGGLLS